MGQDVSDQCQSIFLTAKVIIPLMKAAGKGHIVNLSSVAGLIGLEEAGAYCASKFAVKGLSEVMYKELRKSGVKVTCVYPGSVKTDFFVHYDAVTPDDRMMESKEVAESIINLLRTSANFAPLNLEIRPLALRY